MLPDPSHIFVPEVTHDPIRLAVLSSGGGTTLANLHRRIGAGALQADIAIVICSNKRTHDRITAKKLPGLNVQGVERNQYGGSAEFSDVVFGLIRQANVDVVCLAGFLSLLVIPDDFAHHLINIHPALLPAFGGQGMYGHHVHEAVLAAECEVSGCTVHFADQAYDTGPIILQKSCPVLKGDSLKALAQRVFELECEAYPEAIELLAQGRVSVCGQTTCIERDDLVAAARCLCMRAHAGQKRSGGEPYCTHPIRVCEIIRAAGVENPEILAAACLHDVVEDSPMTVGEIGDQFGPRVGDLVQQMTLPDEPGRTFEQKHRQLAEHARVMTDEAKIIKIADRLHNMSEIHHRPAERWPRYAAASQQLLEALAPWPRAMDAWVDQLRSIITHHMPTPEPAP